MKNRKLVTEVVVLVVIVLLIVVATTLKSGSSQQNAGVPKVVPLKTTFDTDTAAKIQKRDANYTPVPLDDLGKADPFKL